MKELMRIAGGIGAVVLLIGTVAAFIRYKKLRRKTTGAASGLASSLRNEKQKSDLILNGIEDGVILIDDQQTIQLFNPAAELLTGWHSNEAIGLDYHLVLKLVDNKNSPYTEEQNPLSRVFKENVPIRDNGAFLVSRADKFFAISLSVSPLHDTNNKVAGAVAVFRDISQEHGMEQRRAEFISTASHEMRTPVAAIEGYLALALNDRVCKVDAKARSFLEKAHSSTQHLGKLFQDLLTSAKAEDGRLSNHPVVVELGAYLEQVTEDLRFAAQKKNLLTEFIIGDTPENLDATNMGKVIRPFYFVFVDPDRLREVITNLFDNAVKYTESGKVSIGITGDDKVAQFYIKDTGPGIPQDDIPHLFQKFYRVDSSSTRTIGGTGLGLFICRKIIDLYSGRIWVESEAGKGSSFFINLPRLTSQKATELQALEVNSSHAASVASPVTS